MSHHETHRMDAASVAAYHSLDHAKRRAAILVAFAKYGPMTDRQVAQAIGAGEDLNAARPRITELLDDRLVSFVGRAKCPVTGRTVRVCKVAVKEAA